MKFKEFDFVPEIMEGLESMGFEECTPVQELAMPVIWQGNDLIILDPPAFAKHRSALNQALQGYKKLNTRAFQQIRPGGILFTFSCSQVVTRTNFREAVFSAAAISKRNIRILHQLSQPGDHPINIYHPEGEYLKGLVLYVE